MKTTSDIMSILSCGAFLLLVGSLLLAVSLLLAENVKKGEELAITRFEEKCYSKTHEVSRKHTECSLNRRCVEVPAGIHTTPISTCSYYAAVMRGEKTW